MINNDHFKLLEKLYKQHQSMLKIDPAFVKIAKSLDSQIKNQLNLPQLDPFLVKSAEEVRRIEQIIPKHIRDHFEKYNVKEDENDLSLPFAKDPETMNQMDLEDYVKNKKDEATKAENILDRRFPPPKKPFGF